MLRRDRRDRLGDRGGAADVKKHAAFAFLSESDDGWGALRRRELPSPHAPALDGPADTSRFDAYDEGEEFPRYGGDQTPFAAFSSGGFVDDPPRVAGGAVG